MIRFWFMVVSYSCSYLYTISILFSVGRLELVGGWVQGNAVIFGPGLRDCSCWR